jgi:hypothetical protein
MFYLLLGIFVPVAGATAMYGYMKKKHNERLIETLKTLTRGENSMQQPVIQKYVKECVNTMM